MFEYAKPESKQKDTTQKKDLVNPNLTGIPDAIKSRFESLSGFSFDDVRVHYNSDKPAQLQALAYTQGNQVYVAPGQEEHLGHELGHVVQQKAGLVKPTRYIKGNPVNDDARFEEKADKFSDTAATQLHIKNTNQADQVIQSARDDIEIEQVCTYTE